MIPALISSFLLPLTTPAALFHKIFLDRSFPVSCPVIFEYQFLSQYNEEDNKNPENIPFLILEMGTNFN